MNTAQLIARDLLSIGAVFLRPEKPFTWASGIRSPIYCDNRLTLTSPTVRTHVEEGLAALVKEKYPDAEVLMGTSTAGIAHAAITGTSAEPPHGLRPFRREGPRETEPHRGTAGKGTEGRCDRGSHFHRRQRSGGSGRAAGSGRARSSAFAAFSPTAWQRD